MSTIADNSDLAAVPTLKDGEHLTREEFLRRWDASPHIKCAELLEGIVHVFGRVNYRYHCAPHAELVGWLGLYKFATAGVGLGKSGTIGLEPASLVLPDAFFLLPPEVGGQSIENATGYLEGPPDLIGEIAASSASIDMHTKLKLYERTGVPEYIVWRTINRAIDWFILEDNHYVPLVAESGILKSRRFPGLWLDPAALIAGDLRRVYDVLQQGVATSEHAAFAAELAQAIVGNSAP